MKRLGLEEMREIPANPRRLWVGASVQLTRLIFRDLDLRVEGLEHLPEGPVMLAMNHTHKYDFLPIRFALLRARGAHALTWIKLRAWQSAPMRALFERVGNVPLGSKGYVIAADFRETLGRRPTEDEYRALRDHIDGGPAPEGAFYAALGRGPRSLLGRPFDPRVESWGEAALATYLAMGQISLDAARGAVAAGHHMHMYPQGTLMPRLTPGRIGTLQVAHALGLPILPVGCSGMRETFAPDSLRGPGGTLTLRLGAPFRPAPLRGPFRAFDPAYEAAHRPQLEAQTQTLMERIAGLVDADYGWGEVAADEGRQGVARFI